MKKRIIIGSSLVLIIDQLTKYLVETFTSNKIIKIIPNFFNIDFTYNEGGAFSILNGQIILLIALTIICLFFLNTFYKDLKDPNFKAIIFSLLYGGIIQCVIFLILNFLIIIFQLLMLQIWQLLLECFF